MTTPTQNPTAEERRTVRRLDAITRELEARGHVVERLGFIPDRVDGVAVNIPEAGTPKDVAVEISATVRGTRP